MLLRKLVSGLFSSIILSLGLLLMSSWNSEEPGLIITVLFFSLFGNYIYGVPVSFLSEFLTKSLTKSRVYVAGFIYMFFAYLTMYMIEGFAFFSIICAVLFYLIDEGIKVVKDTPTDKSKKLQFLKLLVVIPFTALAIWGVNVQTSTTTSTTTSNDEETNTIYLIPEGYEGSLVVLYNVQNEKSIAKEDEFFMIPLSVEKLPTLKRTDIEEYALFQTSSEKRYGIVTDKYFYVNEQGNRSEIEASCIHHERSRSSDNGTVYEVLQVTNSICGQEFQLSGKERFAAQAREVLKYWGHHF
ncbi:hypothetical protein FZC76_06620 [Sutcliffiella horikoshii]|uniref:DUF6843 domain-containing protein n=1 Tax=Sutcliffiella horikoshii TaxID=79883 RepID=A0A5D4T3I9_9BACI|nr:hypothetical protein [Sutcliffiella horikoshii]TYS69895.1 hypothetical protein FZC76_06620 [Sutcliffiella horikoshii]